MKITILYLIACACFFSSLVSGADVPRPALADPPICSAVRATPSCKSVKRPGNSNVSDIHLTLKAAKATVHVGGYVLESEAYNGTYIPPLIETTPGATINIDLADELPMGPTNRMMAGHTNLHTHGLLVSPQNDTNDFGVGDNILIDLQKGGTFSYHIPIPTALATGILDNPAPIRHPDGLYWYHPHLHGMAKEQVSGGMSGVISIGRGKDLLVVNGANGQQDEPATISLKQHTDVKYLELKDIQMTTAVAPEQATGSAPGIWNADSDPGFCGNVDLTNLTNLSNGYCQQILGTGAAASRQLWLFTINGQRYPRISIGAGRNHLWRIANLSATVTFLIELVDHENPVSFEVMGVDGVVAGNSAAQGGSVAGLKATRLLLMPAGRAEILIRNDGSNPGPDRDLVLRTRGLSTGPGGGSLREDLRGQFRIRSLDVTRQCYQYPAVRVVSGGGGRASRASRMHPFGSQAGRMAANYAGPGSVDPA
jgi:FtsP/CotA-like multicopper oxidase with cupredoxin domain